MDTVLCAIDFSRTTAVVVNTAAALARAAGARLIAFHAVHFASDPLYATDLSERQARVRRLTETAAIRLAASMAGIDLPWEPVVVRGDPVEQLSALVATHGIDLVVTASRGVTPFERLFVGTVVERMVQQVVRPILIVRPGPGNQEGDPFSRILVGCDLRPPALPLAAACRLAGRFAAEMHLLHASESPLDRPLVSQEHGPAEQGIEVLRRELERRLQDACPELRGRGVSFLTAVRPGVPAEALREYARQRSIDLLVVGVHRTGAIKRALIGSTARDLLRRAPCSLLTVPQTETVAGRGA